jgi:putative tryptophan/tyrosine transport system substrate-binding protein
MKKKFKALTLSAMLFALCSSAEAQQAKVYHVGVILQGRPYYDAINGLRDGLKELRLTEGKDFVLEIRDAKGDLKEVEEAARNFEHDKANMIYALTTSAVIAVKNVSSQLPIVFAVGSDPVASGLVQSFVKPGGRLTGIHFSATDLTGKRLEILKEMLPKARRVLTIYNPNNRAAAEAAALARQAGKQFGVQVVERHATSVEELRQVLGALKTKEADAYFYISDAMVVGQAQVIIDTAKAKKLPTMFHERSLVTNGALASYGVSYHEVGRMSARYVQRILAGTSPKDLAVETVHKLELVFNLQTAREIGLTIPPNLLARADKVIR